MDNFIKKYKEQGYFICNLLEEDECDIINQYVEKNDKYAYYEKYSQEKFGYKFDLKEETPVKKYVYQNEFIREIGNKILENFEFSVIKSFYKSGLNSRDIEYHQEYSYNSHHPTRKNWKDYIQIFIALEDHTLENACLKIIPKSHLEGHLPIQNIVNSNLEHKSTVDYYSLKDVSQKYGIQNCILRKGQAIFFNHLIIHCSQNNNSTISRRALVSITL